MLPSLLSSTNCEQYDESEVGLILPRHALPHSIIYKINCWVTPEQLEREEQIVLVNEINRVFAGDNK
jgi:hypothetical protein